MIFPHFSGTGWREGREFAPTHPVAIVHGLHEGELWGAERSMVPVYQRAPSVELWTLNGRTVRTDRIARRGAVGVLVFWTAGCVMCRTYLRELELLYEAHEKDGLKVLGITHYDDFTMVAKFARLHHVHLPLARNKEGKRDAVARFGVRALPSTYVLSPGGFVVDRFVGMNLKRLVRAVNSLGVDARLDEFASFLAG